jgi:hypothetical protein
MHFAKCGCDGPSSRPASGTRPTNIVPIEARPVDNRDDCVQISVSNSLQSGGNGWPGE